MRILFFGDIFGRPGRGALKIILPKWRKQYKPDVIIANVENASHGSGITESAAKEIIETGVDIMTGGNHFLKDNKELNSILENPVFPILRPANFPQGNAGKGFTYFKTLHSFSANESKSKTKILTDATGADLAVISLIGQVNMKSHFDSPFAAADKIISEIKKDVPEIPIVVDFHADAASEKRAMGWFLDGKVSAVIGTHTHTPTANEQILPKGTAFISDVGMVGPYNSIIGQEITANLQRFILQKPIKVDVANAPPYEINAVLIEITDNTGKSVKIERLRKIIE